MKDQNTIIMWQYVALVILSIVLIIIIAKIIHRRFHGNTNTSGKKKKKKRKYYKKAHVKIKTDNHKQVIDAHIEQEDDPLVVAYNAPELVINNSTLRADIRRRMINAINNAEGPDDIETLERIVNINEELDIGDEIMPLAVQAVHRVAARVDNFRDLENNNVQDDPQNVHDPSVIKQLRDELYGINITNSSSADIAADITNNVNRLKESGEISAARANDALRVANTMLSSTGTCSSYDGRRESDILRNVWADINDSPDKIHNLILGLADSATESGTVCMNGRIARVIGANTSAVSQTDIKSAVYNYAGKIMNEGGGYDSVLKYINDIDSLPESQKIILREECKTVFDDIQPEASIPQSSSSTPLSLSTPLSSSTPSSDIQSSVTPIIEQVQSTSTPESSQPVITP